MWLASEDELAAALVALAPHANALDAAVQASGEALEGNILYMHQSFEPNPKNSAKQRNLLSLAASMPLEDSVIMEIGFNAGHSSLLMLSAHPNLKIVAFDLCEHTYTQPCFEALSVAFPGRIQLVPGRSQQTIPRWARSNTTRADLIHIDGDHAADAARTDIQQAALLARHGALVVFDDTCFTPLKGVWNEMFEIGILQPSNLDLCPTSRHGIARYTRQLAKEKDMLLWDLSPVLEHRGRMRHVLVLAPTDHGQDSLLGYLARHRSWQGRASVSRKMAPQTTERHQSPWMSLPLWSESSTGPVPTLVHLVAPPFYDQQQIIDSFPIVDGILVVVDCAEGFTSDLRTNIASAIRHGLQPVLFFNKLDKLLSLEPDNELCYQRLSGMLDEINELIAEEGSPGMRLLADSNRNIVFGRGSLSVAESIGGWGFHLSTFLHAQARHKDLSAEQETRLRLHLWGDHFYTGRGWGASGERGFCKLVLHPLREIYSMLEAGDAERMAKLADLGVIPTEGLHGNAWKQSAMEAWLPLAELLLAAVAASVPAPQALPGDSVFYAARCLRSADSSMSIAFGREVPQQAIPPNTLRMGIGEASSEWFLNGPNAVALSSVNVSVGALRGLVIDSLPEGVPVAFSL